MGVVIAIVAAALALSLRRALPPSLNGNYGLSATQVAERLRAQGMPIERIRTPSSRSAIGDVASFSDRRLNSRQPSRPPAISDGGAVEVLGSDLQASQRASELENQTQTQDGYDFAVGAIVLRLSSRPSSSQADAYQAALRSILTRLASSHHS